MFTLKFKNLRDEQPLPRKRISYYVAKNNLIMIQGGFEDDGVMKSGVTGYDWVGVESCGANSCCYNYSEEEDLLPVGYESKFLEDGEIDNEDEYETFKKIMYINEDGSSSAYVLPFNSDNPEDDLDIEILWEYEHIIRYQVFSQTQSGQNTFPIAFIEPMMEDGLLTVIGTPIIKHVQCQHSGYKYKHVHITFNWLDNLWLVKGSQEGHWEEDAWLDGKYSEMFVFEVEKLGE